MSEGSFRCAAASLERSDPLAGTASTVRAFLLLEHPGPWGVEALRDARLPDGVGDRIRVAAAAAKVRVLLVRRPGRSASSGPRRVFAASCLPGGTRLEAGTLDDPAEVLDLDLAGLRAGGSAGLAAYDGALFCVCTHGRHDTCCAERGRPAVTALAAAYPEETWEVSHIGGDRFAANMLVLPQGLYYGRLEPEAVLGVAAAHGRGHLELEHLRGRSAYAMSVQAAEVHLRRDLGETRDAAVRLTGARGTGDDLVEADFAVTDGSAVTGYRVRVRTVPGGGVHRLTCRATREEPAPRHERVGIERLGRIDP
ncbi:sucrase ferredoxin [Nocardioides pantholopis]|uniref:sucrase ferredoxin n=1 Tax=Nocardioides pantholopis TaxID=2483798 RepID=UPI0019D2B8B3|nr:sucrase ferredoxin [Nocardioides pantholopis]